MKEPLDSARGPISPPAPLLEKERGEIKDETVLVLLNGYWLPGKVLKRIEPKEQFPVLYVVQLPDGVDVFSCCRVRFV